MKNAFGGLLHLKRHWTHSVIHETLVDLLVIQKEIHPGIFAVMDGTISGDGPGPRAMRLRVTNLMLASRDQVAIDATAAKLMGFDPLTIRFIRLAHEAGLGKGDPREIDLVGDDVSNVNLRYSRNENTFASKGQKLIYHGPLKPLEGLLLRSPLVPWSFAASRLYHDGYWYPFVGKGRKADDNEIRVGAALPEYGAEGAGSNRLRGPGRGFAAAPRPRLREEGIGMKNALLIALMLALWSVAPASAEPKTTTPSESGDAPDIVPDVPPAAAPNSDAMPSFGDHDPELAGSSPSTQRYVAEIVDSLFLVGPAEFFAVRAAG